MIFTKVDGKIDNRYSSHEFGVFGEATIIISKGDTFVLNFEAETYKAKVFGYGYENYQNILKMFVTIANDDAVYSIDMMVFSGMLQQEGSQISVVNDNERFFQLRVPIPQDTKELEEFLNNMQGISVKNWRDDDKRRYALSAAEIGYPDWRVAFRYSTNFGGAASFAKLATLVSAYPGQVFIVAKNHYLPEEYVHSHASSTTFFSILGINIPPKLCIDTLKDIDKKSS